MGKSELILRRNHGKRKATITKSSVKNEREISIITHYISQLCTEKISSLVIRVRHPHKNMGSWWVGRLTRRKERYSRAKGLSSASAKSPSQRHNHKIQTDFILHGGAQGWVVRVPPAVQDTKNTPGERDGGGVDAEATRPSGASPAPRPALWIPAPTAPPAPTAALGARGLGCWVFAPARVHGAHTPDPLVSCSGRQPAGNPQRCGLGVGCEVLPEQTRRDP